MRTVRFFCSVSNRLDAPLLDRQRIEMVRSPMVPLAMPQKLRFNITPEVKRDIEKAKQNMNMYVCARVTVAAHAALVVVVELCFCLSSEWSMI